MTTTTSRAITPAAPTSSNWHGQGSCKSYDPDLFFPDGHTHIERVLAAKEICASCPIQPECLTAAFARREKDGLWGGLTEAERRDVLHKRSTEKRRETIEKALNLVSPKAKSRRPGVLKVLQAYRRVVQLKTAGWSQQSIANDLGTSRDSVRKACQLVERTGSVDAALRLLVVVA